MRFKIFIGLFLLTALIMLSCHKGEPILNTRPSGVLSKEKMIEVLVDLNLAEAVIRVGEPQHSMTSDSIYQKSQILKVFEKNEIEPDDFDKSLTYYSGRMDELNEIYEEVINRLTAMEAELKGRKTPKDSLQEE